MRQVTRQRVIAGAVLGALPLLLSTGCSFSIGGPSAVGADRVAERSSEMLAEETGETPDEFTCADDLPAEVGAEIRCELTKGGDTVGVTVTTTGVDGGDVQWEVQVDDALAEDTAEDDSAGSATSGSVPAMEVAEQSAAQLEQMTGQAPDGFTCPQDLPAEVGAEIRCTLLEAGMNYGVTITTTSVDGGDVQWDIQVDDQAM